MRGMSNVDPRAVVVQFPEASRVRRERTLDIAAKLIPVLQEALDSGNATLVLELFAVLGEVARGGEAYARIAAIELKDGEVVGMRGRACHGAVGTSTTSPGPGGRATTSLAHALSIARARARIPCRWARACSAGSRPSSSSASRYQRAARHSS